METIGWAAAVVSVIGAVVWIIGYALDQVPALSKKATWAVRSVRELRAGIRGGSSPSSLGAPHSLTESEDSGVRPPAE